MTSLQRSSHLRISLVWLAATLIWTMPVLAQSAGNCNTNDQGTPPCFANVPDILNGQTRLLPADDLLMNTSTLNEQGSEYPAGGNLETLDSTISTFGATGITNSNASPLSNQISIRGRLFDVDHDQMFSATENTTGQAAALEFADAGISVPP